MAAPTKCKDKVLTDVTIEKPVLEPTGALSVETVLSVKHWNEHLFSFRITRPASFRFRSGEFVMIGLLGDNGSLPISEGWFSSAAAPALIRRRRSSFIFVSSDK